MNVTALDLATTVGFADYAAKVITSGSVCFARKHGRKRTKDEHPGIVFLNFQRWLRTHVADYKPAVFVIESPGFFKSQSAVCIAYGLRAIAMQTAAYHDIPVTFYSPSALKLHATGDGRAKKPAMIAAARRMLPGHTFTTDDEADAVCLLDLFLRNHQN